MKVLFSFFILFFIINKSVGQFSNEEGNWGLSVNGRLDLPALHQELIRDLQSFPFVEASHKMFKKGSASEFQLKGKTIGFKQEYYLEFKGKWFRVAQASGEARGGSNLADQARNLDYEIDPGSRSVKIHDIRLDLSLPGMALDLQDINMNGQLRFRAKAQLEIVTAGGYILAPSLIFDFGLKVNSRHDLRYLLEGRAHVQIERLEFQYPDLFGRGVEAILDESLVDFVREEVTGLSFHRLNDLDPGELAGKWHRLMANRVSSHWLGKIKSFKPKQSFRIEGLDLSVDMNADWEPSGWTGQAVLSVAPQFRLEVSHLMSKGFKEGGDVFQKMSREKRGVLGLNETLSRAKFILKAPIEFPLLEAFNSEEAYFRSLGGLEKRARKDFEKHISQQPAGRKGKPDQWNSPASGRQQRFQYEQYLPELSGGNLKVLTELKFMPGLSEDFGIIYPLSNDCIRLFPSARANMLDGQGLAFGRKRENLSGREKRTLRDRAHSKFNTGSITKGQIERFPRFVATLAGHSYDVRDEISAIIDELLSSWSDPESLAENLYNELYNRASEQATAAVRPFSDVEDKVGDFEDPTEALESAGEHVKDLYNGLSGAAVNAWEGAYDMVGTLSDNAIGNALYGNTVDFYQSATDQAVEITDDIKWVVEKVFCGTWPFNYFCGWVINRSKGNKKMRMYGIKAGQGGNVSMFVAGQTAEHDVMYWSGEDSSVKKINLLWSDAGNYYTNGHVAVAHPRPGFLFDGWEVENESAGTVEINGNQIRVWPPSIYVKDEDDNAHKRITVKALFRPAWRHVILTTEVTGTHTSGEWPGEIELVTGSGGLTYQGYNVARLDIRQSYQFNALSNLAHGFEFSHWGGLCAGSTGNSCTVDGAQLSNGDRLVAVYKEVTHAAVHLPFDTDGIVVPELKVNEASLFVKAGKENRWTLDKSLLVAGKTGFTVQLDEPGYYIQSYSYEFSPVTPELIRRETHGWGRSTKAGDHNEIIAQLLENNPRSTMTFTNDPDSPDKNTFFLPAQASGFEVFLAEDPAAVKVRASKKYYQFGKLIGLESLEHNIALEKNRFDSEATLYYVYDRDHFLRHSNIYFKLDYGWKWNRWQYDLVDVRRLRAFHKRSIGRAIRNNVRRSEASSGSYHVITPMARAARLRLNLKKMGSNFSAYEVTNLRTGEERRIRNHTFLHKNDFRDGAIIKAPVTLEDSRNFTRLAFVKWQAKEDYCEDMESPYCVLRLEGNELITPRSDQRIFLEPVYETVQSYAMARQSPENNARAALAGSDLTSAVIGEEASGPGKLVVAPNPVEGNRLHFTGWASLETGFPLLLYVNDVTGRQKTYVINRPADANIDLSGFQGVLYVRLTTVDRATELYSGKVLKTE